MTHFAVITEVPEDNEGNYSCSEALINPNGEKHIVGSNIIVSPNMTSELFTKAFENSDTKIIDLSVEQVIFCSIPVFSIGEILIMDSNDRTIPDGRKPSKWSVTYETFNDIEKAIKRAREVVDNDRNTM